jgi:hypothetical protein
LDPAPFGRRIRRGCTAIRGSHLKEAFVHRPKLTNGKIAIVDPEESVLGALGVTSTTEFVDNLGEVPVREFLVREKGMLLTRKKPSVVGRHAIGGMSAVDEIKEVLKSIPKSH